MKRGERVIVIGAGHNGLIAAGLLAKRGLKPLVVEARGHIGGMMGDPDFRLSTMPFAVWPQVLRALGVDVAFEPMTTLVPTPQGVVGISAEQVVGAEDGQAAAYRALMSRLERQASALSGLLLKPPPNLAGSGFGDLLGLAGTGLKLRGLGKAELRDLLRIVLSNIHDLIEDEIGDGPLAAALAVDATLGSAMGPRSPGTVLTLLLRMARNRGMRVMPKGGIDILTGKLENAVMACGGEIRTSAPVERILVEGDRVTGVQLAGGEIVPSAAVLSSAAPATTLLDLLGPQHLDAEFVRRCRKTASTGMVARIDFDLKDAPRFSGGTAPSGKDRIVIAESAAAVEAAFNAAKYGELPKQPVMEAHYDDRNRRLSVSAQFIPCSLKGGWKEESRRALQRLVERELARVFPGFGSLAAAARLMTAQDMAAAYRVPGGHWHHGELRIDQLLMLRPFDGAAHYAMPVEGLYLCGAGAHPGGDISGAPGFNGAQALLAGRRR
ncbi:MAG: NAD(P)/FAD-dependent oxidoreductase [Nitratireductor sp.]